MTDEGIIKMEAIEFSEGNWHLAGITQMRLVKTRLEDFYSPEHKAIFLEEYLLEVENKVKKFSGRASESSAKEFQLNFKNLKFYINQELSTLPHLAHQNTAGTSERNRSKVFVSYSHKDIGFLEDIKRHFKPFLKEIDFWDDSRIEPGDKWKEEIGKAIDATKVAILLVTADFLGSEFIESEELPRLLKAADEDGAVILIVLLKPVLFEEFPKLNEYQTMNPPTMPVVKMGEIEREELWVNLVRQTKKLLSK